MRVLWLGGALRLRVTIVEENNVCIKGLAGGRTDRRHTLTLSRWKRTDPDRIQQYPAR